MSPATAAPCAWSSTPVEEPLRGRSRGYEGLRGVRRESGGFDQPGLLAAPRRPLVVLLGLLARAERRPVQQLPLPHLGGVGSRLATEPAQVHRADLVLHDAAELRAIAVGRQRRTDV